MFADLYHAEETRKKLRAVITKDVADTPQMAVLMQLTGIRVLTAYALVAYIGDINRFSNAKKLVAYFGLNPRVNDSDKSVRRGHISKNSRKEIRALLTQCSQSIFNAKTNPKLTSWGQKLQFRKGKNIAVAAVARKLTVAVWYVLKVGYSPLVEVTKELKGKVYKITTETGKDMIKAIGYQSNKEFRDKLLNIILTGT